MRDTLPERVRLGVFEVDLRAGELRTGEHSVFLQEQPLSVLRMLLERPGELITRDEIQKRLWPNDTVVDFDHGINAAIRRLRLAFGDSADEPQYIATVARRGYRLLAPIVRMAGAGALDSSSGGAAQATQFSAKPRTASMMGQKVSHYRVLNVIGGGGMGLVYEAEDLKLGRRVALKFLPEELAEDPTALQRFEREARAASSLDHPNICTIYEVEEYEGQPFIVMQLLRGETLRDRLVALQAAQQSFSISELIEIATQICEGLAAAHSEGIIHRDIKPANVFLTTHGQAKILDFGLAKLMEVEEAREEAMSAVVSGNVASSMGHDLTTTGLTMGTAGYMSPEQVRGEKLDARTDLFSFGLVLYEMATGHRAFTGETAAIVKDAIQNQSPVPIRELVPEISPTLEAIITKCLEKARERRFQTADELASALRSASGDVARRWPLWVALSLMLLLAGLAVARFWWPRPPPTPDLKERQLTANPLEDWVKTAAISPDGRYVAYDDQTGLYIRSIDSGETRPVTLPEAFRDRIMWLRWSPTGENLLASVTRSRPSGVWEGSDIWTIPVLGGTEPHMLYRHSGAPTVSPDGKMIAFLSEELKNVSQEIWVGDINGGQARKLIAFTPQEALLLPVWSPDGQWIAYLKRHWKPETAWVDVIEATPVYGGPSKILLDQSSLPKMSKFLHLSALAWSSDWRLLFSVNEGPELPGQLILPGYSDRDSVWELQVDADKAVPNGQAHRLTKASEFSSRELTISADGKRLAFRKQRVWADLYLGELGPRGTSMKTPVRLTLDNRGIDSTILTPDGKGFLFDSRRNGKEQIFSQGVHEKTAEILVDGPGDANLAALSPDGSWILYWQSESTRNVNGPPAKTVSLMRKPAHGGAPEKVLESPIGAPIRCSANSKATSPCVLSVSDEKNMVFYSLDPLKGKGSQITTLEVNHKFLSGWDISPDGSKLAIVGGQAPLIKVFSLSEGSWHDIPLDPSVGMASSVAWAADGKSLFITSSTRDSFNLIHVTARGEVQVLLRNAHSQLLANPLPLPGGKYLAFQGHTCDSNVWLIDNF